jgi:hypothetical protein
MKTEKQAKLEAAGFRVGTVAEFLGLTPEEIDEIELRLASTTPTQLSNVGDVNQGKPTAK